MYSTIRESSKPGCGLCIPLSESQVNQGMDYGIPLAKSPVSQGMDYGIPLSESPVNQVARP